MGKTHNTGFLQNAVKVASNGDISLMHGNTMLMQISASGAITTTGVISGSNALSASYAVNATTASFAISATSASYALNATTSSFAASATSSSYALNATTASFANNLTVAGTLTAQTLVVQTITSSVDFVTGSTRFGSLAANTHTFTGSVLMSGSLDVNSGSFCVGSNNQIGVNTNSPQSQFVVAAKTGNSASIEINLNNSGYGRIFAYNRSTATAANLVLNDPGGNVGIGATTPLWTLDVRGTIGAMGAGSDGTLGDCIIFGNAGFPATQNNRVRASTSAAGSSNYIVFETSNGTIGSYNTSQLILRGNGNVGIGTSTPDGKLNISGGSGNPVDDSAYAGYLVSRFQNSNQAYVEIRNTGDTQAGLLLKGTGLTSSQHFFIGLNNTSNLRIGYGTGITNSKDGSSGITVQTNGIVGIGINNPSSTTLYVNAAGINQSVSAVEIAIAGSGTFQRGIRMLNGGMVAGESLLYMVGRNSVAKNTGQVYFHYAGDGSNSNRLSLGMFAVDDIVNITAAANVGIGTTSPNHKLDVNGNINIPGTNSIVFNNELGSWGITARTTTSTTNLGASLKNIIICGGGANEGIAFTGVGITAAMEIRNDGAVWVKGTLTKGGGSFRIDHPLPEKKDTHHLYHSFIEGPKADLIYRGKINLIDGTATVNIDEVSTMTEGTFELLTRDAQCFVNNLSGWDLVKGNITGNTLTITSQNTESTDEISWMVVAERNDEWFRDSEMTDDNGNTIVEKLKPTITEEITE